MQKISCYLYPNRIDVVMDVAEFTVRYNIVYQNRIKIYQGIDNVLTLDVKNSEQKRIDISAMDLKMLVTDTAGKEIVTKTVTPMTTTGLGTVNIAETDLVGYDPQFLKFTVYRDNGDTTKTILYADTQFGVKGNMELIGDALTTETPERFITTFNQITNDDTTPYEVNFFSDAVEIRQPNYVVDELLDSFNLDFMFNGLEGDITVQFTKDSVIHAFTSWEDIETFSVVPSTSTVTKTYSYPLYNREMAWARIKFIRTNNNTGTVDKVIIRL